MTWKIKYKKKASFQAEIDEKRNHNSMETTVLEYIPRILRWNAFLSSFLAHVLMSFNSLLPR